jgi:hypothetical protein
MACLVVKRLTAQLRALALLRGVVSDRRQLPDVSRSDQFVSETELSKKDSAFVKLGPMVVAEYSA